MKEKKAQGKDLKNMPHFQRFQQNEISKMPQA